jgi:hypothetical protein
VVRLDPELARRVAGLIAFHPISGNEAS